MTTNEQSAPTWTHPPANSNPANREQHTKRLYDHMRRHIEYAITHIDSGPYRDAEAWRRTPLPALINRIMQQLQAGLGPALSDQAVADGVAVARRILERRDKGSGAEASTTDHQR